MSSIKQYDRYYTRKDQYYYEEPEKDSSRFVAYILLVVTLFIITPIVTGILLLDTNDLNSSKESTPTVKISANSPIEKSYGWQILITEITGTLNLEDAEFQVIDLEGMLKYSVTINDADPKHFKKGLSTIYTMTKGSTVEDDENNIVNGDDAISVYTGCYIAYLDQRSDGKINEGDSFYIFNDNDRDSIDEVLPNYEVKIKYGNKSPLIKVL